MKYLNMNWDDHKRYAHNAAMYFQENAQGKILTIQNVMKACKCTIDVSIGLLGYMYYIGVIEQIDGTHYKIV